MSSFLMSWPVSSALDGSKQLLKIKHKTILKLFIPSCTFSAFCLKKSLFRLGLGNFFSVVVRCKSFLR